MPNFFYPVTSLYRAVGRFFSVIGASMAGEKTSKGKITGVVSSEENQKLKEAEAKIAELTAKAAELQKKLDTAVVSDMPVPSLPPSPGPSGIPLPPPPPLGIPKVSPPLGKVGQRFGSVLDEIKKAHVLKNHKQGKIEKLVEQDDLLKMITEGRSNLGKKKDATFQESATQGLTGKNDISLEMRRLLVSKTLAEARVKGAKEKAEKTDGEVKRMEMEIVALEKIRSMSSVGEPTKESRTRLEDAEGKLRTQAIALGKAKQKQTTEKESLAHQEKLLEAQEKKIAEQKEKEAKTDDTEFFDAVEHAEWEQPPPTTPKKPF